VSIEKLLTKEEKSGDLGLGFLSSLAEETEKMESLLGIRARTQSIEAPSHIKDQINTEYSPVKKVGNRAEAVLEARIQESMFDELRRSQLTIIASSASVKLMIIKREDKNFLSETLKTFIDKKIIDTAFEDLDRPFAKHADLEAAVESDTAWRKYKEEIEENMLKEMAIDRRMNKLLD